MHFGLALKLFFFWHIDLVTQSYYYIKIIPKIFQTRDEIAH
jgi:hypothetical protein